MNIIKLRANSVMAHLKGTIVLVIIARRNQKTR